jgi:hypothetical protein
MSLAHRTRSCRDHGHPEIVLRWSWTSVLPDQVEAIAASRQSRVGRGIGRERRRIDAMRAALR